MGVKEELALPEETRSRAKEAADVAERLGIDWGTSLFDLEQFRIGLDVELEHRAGDPETNVTEDDPLMTGKDRPRSSARVARLLHAPCAHAGRSRAAVVVVAEVEPEIAGCFLGIDRKNGHRALGSR